MNSFSRFPRATRDPRSPQGAWIRHTVPPLVSSQFISFSRSPHETSVGGVTCEKYFKGLEVNLARRPAFSSPYSRNPLRRPSQVEGSHLAAPTLTVFVLFKKMFSYCNSRHRSSWLHLDLQLGREGNLTGRTADFFFQTKHRPKWCPWQSLESQLFLSCSVSGAIWNLKRKNCFPALFCSYVPGTAYDKMYS